MTDHPTPLRAAPDQRVATPSGTDVAFADLICADTGLLHVEFDAIIAANVPAGGGQPSRRPPRRSGPAVADRPRRPARRQPATTAASRVSSAAGRRHPDTPERQRSPLEPTRQRNRQPRAERGGDHHREHIGLATSAVAGRSPPSLQTGSRRAHHTQIGCSASTAHHAGDPRRIALEAGRDDRLDRAERTIRDTAAATSLPCAGNTSEAPPTTSNDQDESPGGASLGLPRPSTAVQLSRAVQRGAALIVGHDDLRDDSPKPRLRPRTGEVSRAGGEVAEHTFA